MKVIFTSDIHGKKELLNYILENYEADYYYDCGDSQLTNKDLKEFYSVMGNCDYEYFPYYRVVNVDDLNILITHGHLYTQNDLIKLSKINNCKIIVTGHTHIKKLEMKDNIYFLNPGSVSKPRGGNDKTFVIMEYNEDKKISFEFIKISL